MCDVVRWGCVWGGEVGLCVIICVWCLGTGVRQEYWL